MEPDIAVVDYGMGNLRSVQKALEFLGFRPRFVRRGEELSAAGGVVVPGVGAFPDAMGRLEGSGLAGAVRAAAAEGTPLLGICLGMQILFEWGEEDGGAAGLGLLPGRVVRLDGRGGAGAGPAAAAGAGPAAAAGGRVSAPGGDGMPAAVGGLKVPHMGWNTVNWEAGFPLFQGLSAPCHFYFVHSYCVPAGRALPQGVWQATCEYGRPFLAAVQRGNVMGVQFHPEKSGRAGLALLANFGAMCRARAAAGRGGGGTA